MMISPRICMHVYIHIHVYTNLYICIIRVCMYACTYISTFRLQAVYLIVHFRSITPASDTAPQLHVEPPVVVLSKLMSGKWLGLKLGSDEGAFIP